MSEGGAELRIQTTCLLCLTGLGLLAGAYALREVLIPFVLAVFAAWSLSPVVEFLQRRLRAPRVVAVGLTLILSLFIFLLVGAIVSNSVAQLAGNVGVYTANIKTLITRLETSRLMGYLPFKVEDLTDQLLQGVAKNLGTALTATTNSLFGLLSQGAMVMLYLVFIMLGSPTGPRPRVWVQVDRQVRSYIAAKTALSVVTGVLFAITLGVLGIDLAMVFGLLACLLNFIPNLGSVVSTLLPLPVILLNPNISPLVAILAILIPGTIHFVIGNLVEPKLMGDTLDLHPVVVLLTLMIGGAGWGIMGMVLATPMTAILKIWLEHLAWGRALASMLSGRREASADQTAQPQATPV